MGKRDEKVVEAAMQSLANAKLLILQLQNEIERLKLPGVSPELRDDCLRALRGSATYLDVLANEVYASEADRAARGRMAASLGPITQEVDQEMLAYVRRVAPRTKRAVAPTAADCAAGPTSEGFERSVYGSSDAGPPEEDVYEVADFEEAEGVHQT